MIVMNEVHPNEATAVKVGDLAPDFTLTDTAGKDHTLLEAVKNGPVVLVFYRGDWCPYCQLQTAKLAQAYDKFVAAGAQLWAISPQSRSKNIQFRDRRDIQYPILEDVDHAVIEEWGLVDELDPHQEEIPFPTTYIINENGRVHWRKLGKTKDDRPTPDEILTAIPLK